MNPVRDHGRKPNMMNEKMLEYINNSAVRAVLAAFAPYL